MDDIQNIPRDVTLRTANQKQYATSLFLDNAMPDIFIDK